MEIKIYTTKYCWKCKAITDWLKDKAIPFTKKDAWKYEKLLVKEHNLMNIPVLEIDGKFSDDYNNMKRLIKDGLKNESKKTYNKKSSNTKRD